MALHRPLVRVASARRGFDRVARGGRQSNSHPFNLGVDFTGGTIVNAKFKQKPDPGVIRAAIEKQGIDGSKITIQPVGEEIGQAPKNEVLIRLPNIPVTEGQGGQSGEAKSAESRADNSNLRKPPKVRASNRKR